MTAELRRSLVLALAGLIGGFILVLAWFGPGDIMRRLNPGAGSGASSERSLLSPPAPDAARPAERDAGAAPPRAPTAPEERQATAVPPQTPAPQPPAPSAAPSFDLVRVEPNGESVVAGRGAPNTAVELLVNGRPVARAIADPQGQFAMVPPPLAPGDSEIVLRSTDGQGGETRSRQSVAVVVAPNRDAKPLVALSAPDQPTVVLSQPDPAAVVAKGAEASRQAAGSSPAPVTPGGTAPGKPPAQTAAKDAGQSAPPVKIVSVDAQEGGRLFVTSQAVPGATVRLYLNDTLIAPASTGPDGKATFTIGRGVKPGDYRVRIDQVDSVTGKVKARAEVPFTVPEAAVRVAGRDPGSPPSDTTRPGVGHGGAPAPPANLKPQPEGSLGVASHAPEQRPATGPAATVAKPADPPSRAETPPNEADRPARAVATAGGAVAEPVEPPQAVGKVFVAEINTARISRGDSLWQISRRAYGLGNRYTVIYDANQEQIRNPDLIYPGQIFVLPEDRAAAERGGGKRG
ncbi:LysM peptidoglycan-binding domain-containing protein [Methylobacterium sp. A54F]